MSWPLTIDEVLSLVDIWGHFSVLSGPQVEGESYLVLCIRCGFCCNINSVNVGQWRAGEAGERCPGDKVGFIGGVR